ncbi:MAG: DMT family transporter [Pseudomonadota bacterium]
MLPHIYLLISAFLLALGAVLAKWFLSGGSGSGMMQWHPLPFLMVQLMGSMVLLLGTCLISGDRPGLRSAFLILPGIVAGAGSICTILALHFMTASEASLIFATQPVIVLVLAWALLSERVSLATILCVFGAVFGVVGIVQTGAEDGSINRSLGIGFAIASTTFAGLYVVWMRHRSGVEAPALALLIIQSVALLMASVAWIIAGLPGGMRASIPSLTAAAFTGAIYYGAAFLFYLFGMAKVEASKAGIYLSLVPVFTVGLAYVFLDELLTRGQMAGAVLILVSVGCVAILSIRQTRAGA